MSGVSRRGFIGGTAALGGAVTVGMRSKGAPEGAPPLGPVTVRPGDPRYADLVVRRTNQRFRHEPEYFQVVGSTEQVVKAVGDAVRAGRRVTVRSGGHCYENFVGDGAQVVIDMCEMSEVYFDERRGAFAVEPGATLMQAYRKLYLGWGVTIPGGQCGGVAAGGHIVGGAYGPLSRLHGSVVDYLHAVEVVVVDAAGRARAVVATRDPSDPNHDLWWAHTGGGGGNFGIVTRYWLRDPKARGGDPTRLLPKPPPEVLSNVVAWGWEGMTKESYRTMLRNHGEWHERNSAPGSPANALWSVLLMSSGKDGGLLSANQADATAPGAEELLQGYVKALTKDVAAEPYVSPVERLPWYQAVRSFALDESLETGLYKGKSAYLRKRFTDEQADTAYDHLVTSAPEGAQGGLWLASYGGQVNAVAPGATAMPQRDSILKAIYLSTWEKNDEKNLDWIRGFYRKMYEKTGGVPVPGDNADGAYINYPDVDLADPKWNTSGVPWHTLYYKDNYRRLQQVKARWDPRNVFRHGLSVTK
ncbi:BBE domain-containing protein [Streptosporangium soli]|nr:FAD-binding protein [Streptosporangium sp. KLBMP 9127]